MRYLWIEDFDGGRSGRTENQKKWETYFDIKNQYILIETLEKVLNYLDKKDNWKEFDAVLIDIRFPLSNNHNKDKEIEIYNKYYKSFLTKEKYDSYVKINEDDYSSASSGILLYLALIYQYNYSRNRIAFISANVDGTGNELECLRILRGKFFKSMYQSLNEDDLEDISEQSEELYELCHKWDRDSDFVIPPRDEIDWNCTAKYIEYLDELEDELSGDILDRERNTSKSISEEQKQMGLKYDSVKYEFSKAGLKVPKAFEKPVSSPEKLSWDFKHWKESCLISDYYLLRGLLIPIIMYLKKKLGKPKSSSRFPFDKVLNNTHKYADIQNMLDNIEELLPANEWVVNQEYLYNRLIFECVAIAENATIPKEERLYKHVAILKLARNWMAHQGIKNISTYDVLFIFWNLIKGLFISDDDELKDHLNNIIIAFGKNNEGINTDGVIDSAKNILQKRNLECVKEYCKKRELDFDKYNNRKTGFRYNQDANMYDRVSSIGHQYSCHRTTVCMEYLYMIYFDKEYNDKGNPMSNYLISRMSDWVSLNK